MKQFSKFFVVVVFVTIIGMSMVGCELPGEETETILEGTWIGGATEDSDDWMWIFSGADCTLKEKDGSTYTNTQKGPFSLNSSETRLTWAATHEWQNGAWVTFNGLEGVCDINVSGNTLTMTSHGDTPGWPTSWTETYRKQ